MCNILELSGLFICLGGLFTFYSAWETETIARLWFARGLSTQVETMDQWHEMCKCRFSPPARCSGNFQFSRIRNLWLILIQRYG